MKKNNFNVLEIANYLMKKTKKPLTHLEIHALVASVLMKFYTSRNKIFSKFFCQKVFSSIKINTKYKGLLFGDLLLEKMLKNNNKNNPFFSNAKTNFLHQKKYSDILIFLDENLIDFQNKIIKKHLLNTYLMYFWYPLKILNVNDFATFFPDLLFNNWGFVFHKFFLNEKINSQNILCESNQLIIKL